MELRIWSAAVMVVVLIFLYECTGKGLITKTKNGTPARPNHKFITRQDWFLQRQNNRTTYVKHKRSKRNHRSRAEKRKKREPFKFSDETNTIHVVHHKQWITSGSQTGSFRTGGRSYLRFPVQKSTLFQNKTSKRKGRISDHSYGRTSLKRRDQQGSEEAEEGLNRRSRNRVKLKLPHSEQVKKKNESLVRGVDTGNKRQRISGGFFQAPNGINGAQEMVPDEGIRLAGDTNGFSLTEMADRPKHGLNPPHIFSPAVHKYMPVEHRYDGGPIHRYLNSPVVFRGENRQSYPFMPGPMTEPFGGEGITPMFEGRPARGHRIIIVNRPVKTPFPVPVHGPPRVVLVRHPVPLPPQRVPVPVVVQHQRRPPIVIVHHKEYAGPVIDPCGVNPCRNGGTCSAIGSEFRCICPVGYKSERCEVQSKCFPNPCKNFGKCTELPDDYECTCHSGFHGKSCDLESKCEPNPCRNGGVCTENLEAYICSCSRGFMGKNCEQESKCLPVNPCKNGGVCTEGIGGYKCNCRDGFSGINCEVRDSRSPCDSNPCHNGATCIVDLYDSTKFSCYCAPGFTGFDCLDVACTNCPSPGQCVEGVCVMDYINAGKSASPFPFTLRNSPCGSINPCLFGGHCVPNGEEYSCLCPDSRSGLHCEHLFRESSCDGCHRHAVCIASKCTCRQGYTGDGKICRPKTSHCHPNPCENGGSCHEDENAGTNDPEWWCECTKGYSGLHCHEYDPCADYKCHNGGRCEAVNFEPHCKCEAPWEGPTCLYDNFCLPRDGVNRNPCKNGGKCEFVNNEVSCVCPVQYEGPRCEVDKCDKCDKNAFCEKGICKCKPPYSGDGIDCVLENAAPPTESYAAPNFCDSSPCQNGATCVDGKSTFYCACRQDTFGRLCEKASSFKPTTPPPKAVCHPNPCLNGGLCKETGVNQDFDCICPNARYKGRFCDVDMCAECDPHARCLNGKCFCRKGYVGDGYSCKKVKPKCGCPPYATCIGGSACICNPGYYMNTSGKRTCIPIVQSLPVSPTVKQGTKSVSSVLDADPTSRAKQWSEDIIVTEYRNVGCWSDTTDWRNPSKRALMVMEGLDPLLSGDYRTRHQPISKCADVAKRLGFRVFAVQNGGQCFGGSDDTSYKRYGPSEKCLNGVDGPLANDVYKL